MITGCSQDNVGDAAGRVGSTSVVEAPSQAWSRERQHLEDLICKAANALEALTCSFSHVAVPTVSVSGLHAAAQSAVAVASHTNEEEEKLRGPTCDVGVNETTSTAAMRQTSLPCSDSSQCLRTTDGVAPRLSLLVQLPASARLDGAVEQATQTKRVLDAYDDLLCSTAATLESPDPTQASSTSSRLRLALNRRLFDDACSQRLQLVSCDTAPVPPPTRDSEAPTAQAIVSAQLQPLAQLCAQFRSMALPQTSAVSKGAAADGRAQPLTFVTPASLAEEVHRLQGQEDAEVPMVEAAPRLMTWRSEEEKATAGISVAEQAGGTSSGAGSRVVAAQPGAQGLIDGVVRGGRDACEGFMRAVQGEHMAACCTAAGALPPTWYVIVRDLAKWLSPYVRLVHEVLQRPSLEDTTNEDREQLRRISFDSLALQRAQEQAVADGDMKKSEDVYLEHVQLLESMERLFDSLRSSLARYRQQWSEHPRETLALVQQECAEKLAPVMESARTQQVAIQEELQSLRERVEDVRRARKQQKASIIQYRSEWNRLYTHNVKEQRAVCQAMQELEKRMKRLGEEQVFLIRDRVDTINTEHERHSDAAVFFTYADEREALLRQNAIRSEQLLMGLREYQRGAHDSAHCFEQYLRSVIEGNVESSLVNLEKARLSQFRQLYLTLGELSFKKARHAEEVQKKVDYYALQQEVAMDTFNPKAKTFSQAKRQWEDVHAEVKEQLAALEATSQKKLHDFEPTARFLLEAGVSFRPPQEELEEHNARRQQKLLDYKAIMETNVLSCGGGAKQITAGAEKRASQPQPLSSLSSVACQQKTRDSVVPLVSNDKRTDAMNDAIDREWQSVHTRMTR